MSGEGAPSEAPEGLMRFPLSSTQQRCWVLDRMSPGTPGLNVPFLWIVEGAVSTDAVEEAFRRVIARHEILRTRLIEAEEGGAVQEVLQEMPFALGRIDVSRASDPWSRMEEIAAEEALRPFNLGQAGLLRVLHIGLGSERAALCMTFHQSVFDGYSLGVLAREVSAVLRAGGAGVAELPPLEMQYGDYCRWQAAVLETPAIAAEERWWRDRLDGAPYTEIPPDGPRPATRSAKARRVERALPPDFDARLEAASERLGASPFALGATALSACLHGITGAGDVVFGTQVGGRPDTLLEGVIGPFVNNVVLRLEADPDRAFADQAGHAAEVVREALARRALPFDRLVRALNPPRDPSRTPLISVNLQLFREFTGVEDGPGFRIVPTPSVEAGAIYDVAVVMVGREAGWSLAVTCAADLFEPETCEAIAAYFVETFEALLDAPERTIGSVAPPPRLARRDASSSDGPLAQAASALIAHPDVADAAVIETAAGPHAFVTPPEGRLIALEALPGRLMDHLPSSAGAPTVSRISVIAAMPRGASGGIDRAALRGLVEDAATSGPPPAETLAALAGIWSEVLGVPAPDPEDDFFALGGHSLLAVRMATRVRDRLGAEIDLGTIYTAPTLGALAARIGRAPPDEAGPDEAGHVLRLRGGDGLPLIGINNAAIVLGAASVPGRERPAMSLQMMVDGVPPTGDPPPFEEIAARYADYAEAARPQGAILLFGNCVHGNLAVEVARVLRGRGREIAGVVLKNVWEPAYTDRIKDDARLRWRERRAALRNRIRLWRMGAMPLDALLGSYRVIRATGVLQIAARLGLVGHLRRSELEPEQEAFIMWLTEARNRHRPGPVDFPLLHVVTDISPRGPGFAPSIGWEEIASDLTTVDIPDVLLESGQRIGIEAFADALHGFLKGRGGPDR